MTSRDVPPHELYTEGRHAFEFERAVSRLMEMQSTEFLEAAHVAAEHRETS
jgi:cell division protein ZapE